jgi:hypothetical protein
VCLRSIPPLQYRRISPASPKTQSCLLRVFGKRVARIGFLRCAHPRPARASYRRSQTHERARVRSANARAAGGWRGGLTIVITASKSTTGPRYALVPPRGAGSPRSSVSDDLYRVLRASRSPRSRRQTIRLRAPSPNLNSLCNSVSFHSDLRRLGPNLGPDFPMRRQLNHTESNASARV